MIESSVLMFALPFCPITEFISHKTNPKERGGTVIQRRKGAR